jgi:hypothetical protein
VLIGFSFPFLLGAIHNSVYRWFPKKEKTIAFAIASMPVALAVVIKFSFVTFPMHESGSLDDEVNGVEIIESLLISAIATAAVLKIKD